MKPALIIYFTLIFLFCCATPSEMKDDDSKDSGGTPSDSITTDTTVIDTTTIDTTTIDTTTIDTTTIDTIPTVAFNTTISNSTEGNAVINLQVNLSGTSSQAITVPYIISGSSTATGSGTDYTNTSAGSITITAGNTSQNIVLTLVEDLLDEVDETIIVTLGTPTNANAGGSSQTHTVTIIDNDATTTISLLDSFDGNGSLVGYVTNNSNSLPDVTQVGGRYRANLTNNNNNITLHYNNEQGRLDAKLITFPFEVIARNIGIGTQADSQVPPSNSGNPYLFAGVQVHIPNLDTRTSAHVVVGHRGGAPFTVEGKSTTNGFSFVTDAGANIVPSGRADIRIVGTNANTLIVYWQTPKFGSETDNWNLYNGNGILPGSQTYGNSVYVGLITYAFNTTGVPFVGTCDSFNIYK